MLILSCFTTRKYVLVVTKSVDHGMNFISVVKSTQVNHENN